MVVENILHFAETRGEEARRANDAAERVENIRERT
jgi:hypothetical protein